MPGIEPGLSAWLAVTLTKRPETCVHKITNVPVVYMALGLNDFEVGNIHYEGHLKGGRVSDPYTLYTDPYPDPAFSNFFGSGSGFGFSVLFFALNFFCIF